MSIYDAWPDRVRSVIDMLQINRPSHGFSRPNSQGFFTKADFSISEPCEYPNGPCAVDTVTQSVVGLHGVVVDLTVVSQRNSGICMKNGGTGNCVNCVSATLTGKRP